MIVYQVSWLNDYVGDFTIQGWWIRVPLWARLFHFVNLARRSRKSMQLEATMTFTWPITCSRQRFDRKIMAAVCISISLLMLAFKTSKERLVSELTRSDSFYVYFALNDRDSSCVYIVGRHERSSDCLDTVLSVLKFIIIKYRLFMNRKNCLIKLKSFNGAVVRAPASGIRGREFETRTIHFPSNQIIFFSLSFLLFFSISKENNVRIYIESMTIKNLQCERSQAFYQFFSKLQISHIRAQ